MLKGISTKMVLFSTNIPPSAKQWSESSIGYSHNDIWLHTSGIKHQYIHWEDTGFCYIHKNVMVWAPTDFCYMHNNVMNSHLSKHRPHTCLQNQWPGHVFEPSLCYVSISSTSRNTHGKHIPSQVVYRTLLCLWHMPSNMSHWCRKVRILLIRNHW